MKQAYYLNLSQGLGTWIFTQQGQKNKLDIVSAHLPAEESNTVSVI